MKAMRFIRGVLLLTWFLPWIAQASDNNNKKKYLGYFNDITEAAAVVQNFRNEMGNYSDRHGAFV